VVTIDTLQSRKSTNSTVDAAVIVPVSERYDDVASLYREYKTALETYGRSFEFVYVLDGEFRDVFEQLQSLQRSGERIRIVQLAKWFGEATALAAGFENSRAEIILTLPAYYQVDPSEIPNLLEGLSDCDMVIGRRNPRVDSKINQIQAKVFHALHNAITGDSFHDLGSGVRAFRRQVIREVPVYGDQHRFLPVLASRRGFRVREIDVTQSKRDRSRRIYRPGIYVRRILDVMTVFFLAKFTKKPLRFFGLIGTFTFAVGTILLIYLAIERLFLGVDLAERPALLLSSLLVVLGVQIFAMGLIGELIIFTHASNLKEYTIERIVE